MWTERFPFCSAFDGTPTRVSREELEKTVASLDFPAPETLNPRTPEWASRAIRSLLSKPEERYVSAAAFLDSLRGASQPQVQGMARINDLQTHLATVYGERNRNAPISQMIHHCLAAIASYRDFYRRPRTQDEWMGGLVQAFAWLCGTFSLLGLRIEDVLFLKLPSMCPYCRERPCICSDSVSAKEREERFVADMVSLGWPRTEGGAPPQFTIAGYCALLEDVYGFRAPNTDWTGFSLYRIYEGGLAALRSVDSGSYTAERQARAKLVSGLADVAVGILMLCTAGGIEGTELERRFWETYSSCPFCKLIPCACPPPESSEQRQQDGRPGPDPG